MEKIFVNYDLAQLARSKGFEDPCMGVVFPDEEVLLGAPALIKIMENKDESSLRTPTHQQLQDWLRTKNIEFVISWYIDENKKKKYSLNVEDIHSRSGYDDYYDAYNEALKYSLETLL